MADEVTIVVFSEMGREPTLNTWAVRPLDLHKRHDDRVGRPGGTVVGCWMNPAGGGADPDTGAATDGGRLMGPDDFGATLLALGGGTLPFVGTEPEPIRAVLQS